MRLNRINVDRCPLWVLLITQFTVTLSSAGLTPIMPLYLQSLQGSSENILFWSSMALSTSSMTAMLFGPWVCQQADRYGCVPILLLSISLYGIGLVVLGMTEHVMFVVFVRFLHGFSALSALLTLTFLGHSRFDRRHGRNLGWQQTMIAMGFILGPILGGMAVDHGYIHGVFMVFSGVILLIIIVWLFGPQLHHSSTSESCESGEKRIEQSLWQIIKMVASHPSMRTWLLAGCLIQAAAYALINMFPFYLMEYFTNLKNIASQTGWLHTLGYVGAFLGASMWGRLSDRHGPRWTFILGCFFCMLFMSMLLLPGLSLIHVGVLRVLYGFGSAALVQSVFAHVARDTAFQNLGSRMGLTKSLLAFGHVWGPWLANLMFPVGGVSSVILTIILVFTLAGALVFYVSSKDRAKSLTYKLLPHKVED